MEAKHTPGPWEVVYDNDEGYFINSSQGKVAYPIDENEANARLIAAAPDLLAALENTTARLNEVINAGLLDSPKPTELNLWKFIVQESVSRAIVAIAKARGGA